MFSMGRRHRQKYKRCKQFSLIWNGLIVLFKKVQTLQKWWSQNALRQVSCVQLENSIYNSLDNVEIVWSSTTKRYNKTTNDPS